MAAGPSPEALERLRQTIRTDQGFGKQVSISLGVPSLDQRLGGGLARGALHEIAAVGPVHIAAASGFALALAVRARERPKATLLILPDLVGHESGYFYGPGLDLFGLPAARLVILRAPRVRDALPAMEEALKCRALSCVIAETDTDEADLTATRRLSLAARDTGGFGILVRHRRSAVASAAATRWTVAAASGPPDRFGGIGKTAFRVALIKNRRGSCGEHLLIWNHHDGTFVGAADPVGLAAPASDRPDRAARAVAY